MEAPDIQIHFASGATLYNNEGKIEPLKIPAMSAVVNQSRPESRGSIHIRTAEASDAPEIHANYSSADLDRQTIIKGVRLLLDIFSAEPLQDHLTEGYHQARISIHPRTKSYWNIFEGSGYRLPSD